MESSKHIKLSELNSIISDTIKNKFSALRFWIIADVTSHSFNVAKRYHNFILVEKNPQTHNIIAKVSGKAWGSGSISISDFEKNTGQKFTDNIHVLVQVSVEYHEVYGLSVNVLDIDTSFTLGVIEQRRNQTLLRLVSENIYIQKVGDNYITTNNRLKFRSVVQRIALLSSPNSAGSEDFKHTLDSNNFGYKFYIDDYFTIVQGENNAKQFYDKIIEIYNSEVNYDVVVITRGGGTQTDFLIFDDYQISRAVAKFPIPIITGIGHQKNVSIVDLMAHTQTKTPTKAAEFIIAHNREFEHKILALQKSIIIKSQQLFFTNFHGLSALNNLIIHNVRAAISTKKDAIVSINQVTINTSKSIIFNHRRSLVKISSQILSKTKIILYNRINDIKNTISNFKTFNSQYQKNKRGYLGHYVSIIKMMAPENILKKGYAIIKVNGKITSDPDDVKIGDELDIILSSALIKSTVKHKSTYNGTDINI